MYLGFADLCLPQTMDLAKRHRWELRRRLQSSDEHWHFEDRILALLLPTVRGEIERFYGGGGPSMIELYNGRQLREWDDRLLEQLREMGVGLWYESEEEESDAQEALYFALRDIGARVSHLERATPGAPPANAAAPAKEMKQLLQAVEQLAAAMMEFEDRLALIEEKLGISRKPDVLEGSDDQSRE